ncbi:alpha/beta fold hydrolase [bacterium]|nr:alpha/beta fold hydrolase [bacterium]
MKPSKFFLLLLLLGLASCSAPILVNKIEPPKPPSIIANPAPQDAGLILDRIAISQAQLDSAKTETLKTYNYLVSRLIDHLTKTQFDISEQAFVLQGANRTYRLKIEEPADLKGIKQTVISADRLEFTGDYAIAANEEIRGLGAPVVSTEKESQKSKNQHPFLIAYRPLTAVVNITTSDATLKFLDPYKTETVSLPGITSPIAADYNAAPSLGLSETRLDKLGFARMLNPSRYDHTAKLNFLQPYDRGRIPVLFVHGLQSTAATWLPMYLELMDDPEIRNKYQFWTFSYPSGYPFPYSANLLREQLDTVAKAHPNHKDIVIIGHSMGTLLSRLMISDAGDNLWKAFFKTAPRETVIDRKSRRILEDIFVFDSRTDISRAIFYSGPHQGSDLATGWIGRLGSKLVRLPSTFADLRNSVINIITVDTTAMKLDRAANSIDTLAPNNRLVRETAKLPRRSDVPVHSIMGDRGKGDTPNSSDGIVPYWSAHLQNQTSERIVPSNHGSHQHPEGIAEARRILRENIGLSGN